MADETLIINFIGGPGAGKSSLCAATFAELKWMGYNCEMALEYAKDKVWEDSLKILENQIYIFGKQQHRINRLVGQVDIILTDSPLILSLMYGEKTIDYLPSFGTLVLETFNSYDNYNILVERVKKYNPKGRVQTEQKAKQLDTDIKEILQKWNIQYSSFVGSRETVVPLAELVSEVFESRRDFKYDERG